MVCIQVKSVEDEHGDCDYGCWNSAYGFEIKVDGVEDESLKPHASCCESESFTAVDLANYILKKARIHGAENIHVEQA